MKGRVEPEVQQKPEDEATKSKGTAPKQLGIVLKRDKKSNKMACKRQFIPASYAEKSINKPNLGGKPPSPNGNCQNKSQIRDVPSYIRTEMEILKHLKRVNHNLKILLKPECHCHKMPHGQKCCQPARKRKEQQALMAKLNLPTQRKSSSSSSSEEKRASASLKSNTADEDEATETKKDQRVEPKDHATQQRNHKCMCGKKCEAVVRHPPGPTKFQRFILYFKPKRGGICDNCKCAQGTAVGEIKEQDAKTKQAADGEFLHRKCGYQRCEKHLPTITTQDSKVAFKTRRARNHKQGKKSTKDEGTLKQKMQGSCNKCLGKGGEPSRKTAAEETVTKKEKKRTEKQEKTTPDTALEVRKENFQTSNQEPGRESPKEKEPEKENEKVVAVAEVLQKYFRLFKPRKKEPQGDNPEEKNDLSKEYSLKKPREKKDHDVLTTLNFFPKPSHVEELKKNKANPQRETCYYEANESNMKAPTDTPSTSSLEEYFQRLSERMAREQKEADERKPPPRRKRVTGRTRLQQPRQQPRRMRICS